MQKIKQVKLPGILIKTRYIEENKMAVIKTDIIGI